ncbi:MAG: hypothetical protein RLZZ206_3605, partial [Cyanobacteriota bacterium]
PRWLCGHDENGLVYRRRLKRNPVKSLRPSRKQDGCNSIILFISHKQKAPEGACN